MSMMMPPGAAPPGLPIPPGGGGLPGPMDSLAGQSLPTGGGMDGLLAALGGGGGAGPDAGPAMPPGDNTTGGTSPAENAEMDSVQHIQQAMKHLMMALAKEPDEADGAGITKGMGAIQGILAGKAKKDSQLQQLGA